MARVLVGLQVAVPQKDLHPGSLNSICLSLQSRYCRLHTQIEQVVYWNLGQHDLRSRLQAKGKDFMANSNLRWTSESPVWVLEKKQNRRHCVPECGIIVSEIKKIPWTVSLFTNALTMSNFSFRCVSKIISAYSVLVEKQCIYHAYHLRDAICHCYRRALGSFQ